MCTVRLDDMRLGLCLRITRELRLLPSVIEERLACSKVICKLELVPSVSNVTRQRDGHPSRGCKRGTGCSPSPNAKTLYRVSPDTFIEHGATWCIPIDAHFYGEYNGALFLVKPTFLDRVVVEKVEKRSQFPRTRSQFPRIRSQFLRTHISPSVHTTHTYHSVPEFAFDDGYNGTTCRPGCKLFFFSHTPSGRVFHWKSDFSGPPLISSIPPPHCSS